MAPVVDRVRAELGQVGVSGVGRRWRGGTGRSTASGSSARRRSGTADRAVLVRVACGVAADHRRRLAARPASDAGPQPSQESGHQCVRAGSAGLFARRTVFLADPDDGLDLGDGDGYRFGQDLTMTLVPVTWEQSPDLSRRDPMPESGEVDTSGSDVGIDGYRSRPSTVARRSARRFWLARVTADTRGRRR